MKFNIVNRPKANGIVRYRAEEHSFDTFDGEFSNTAILVNDINLGFNVDTAQIVQLWGFSPRSKWKTTNCPTPSCFEGSVIVSELSNTLFSKRLNGGNLWEAYYNPTSGWLCIDSENFRFSQGKCVCFINNACALISDGNLLALWLKVCPSESKKIYPKVPIVHFNN